MKSVMLSIQPKWCELIASGKKTIEVRKSRPKIDTPFKVYIYETTAKRKRLMSGIKIIVGRYGRGKVIGEFVCDCIDEFACDSRAHRKLSEWGSCLTEQEIRDYCNGQDLYGWHISELKIYDIPKALGEFWAYNEEWHKRFDEQYGYCYYDATTDSGEVLIDCAGYKGVYNCYRCWEEWSGWCHKLTRPPQSWCYVEESL